MNVPVDGQKRTSDPWDLELLTVVTSGPPDVGARKQTRVLWKSRKDSKPLSPLSRPLTNNLKKQSPASTNREFCPHPTVENCIPSLGKRVVQRRPLGSVVALMT